jgi:hypothetical protein
VRFSVSLGVCGGRVIIGPGDRITYSLTLGFPLSSLGWLGWLLSLNLGGVDFFGVFLAR